MDPNPGGAISALRSLLAAVLAEADLRSPGFLASVEARLDDPEVIPGAHAAGTDPVQVSRLLDIAKGMRGV